MKTLLAGRPYVVKPTFSAFKNNKKNTLSCQTVDLLYDLVEFDTLNRFIIVSLESKRDRVSSDQFTPVNINK